MEKERQSTLDVLKRFWLIELWVENRELFKEFVKHALLLLLLVGGLESFHRLLNLTSFDRQELKLFSKLHFYMSALILLIFASSFILKALKSEFGGHKNDKGRRKKIHHT